ncbi:MAG: rod shape-determining protein MreD [candidate division KSB1 bacterium]|nr:rod shape-determining protein MreD [candidate division KSB1 bacterium]MDZ7319166.1 rod shape-determining protein MreD [candidate division KSB1 bacterium]MDZ7341429.1 rod shape-determining protein MreD [candidate division KSB1 bacterium]
MQFVKYIFIFLVALFIEKNLISFIAINDITPDLILIFVIIFSLRENRPESTIVGFAAGLVQDAFTTTFFGLSALTKTIVGFWGCFFHQPRRQYTLVYYMGTSLLLVLTHDLIYQIIYRLGGQVTLLKLLFYHALPRSVYTLFAAAVIYLIFGNWLWKYKRTADRL